MRNFYQKTVFTLTDFWKLYHGNIPKLTENESLELYEQIQCSKNNKRPDTDGFTNEFLKILWDGLKYIHITLLNFFVIEEKY